MGTDDTAPESSTGEEYEATDDQPEQPGSSPDTNDGEGDGGEEREPTVPYSRFRQVNEAAKYHQRRVAQLEAERRAAQESKAQPDANYTEEQLAAVRAVMRKSDEKYREMLASHEASKAAATQREQELLDDTHDEIMKVAKQVGLPVKDQEYMAPIGLTVMYTIRNDPKMYRQWERGDLTVVAAAFDKLTKGLIGPLRGRNGGGQGNVARIKRQLTSLPTAPSGGAGTVTAPPKSKDEKGITKQTHDRAWALLQQQSE